MGKVVDTLAPTLRINAQGMEQINKYENDAYSLRSSDNSQNAFSDKQGAYVVANGRTTAATTQVEVLKKMNSHHHDKVLINEYDSLTGAGSVDETETCNRSGKIWRKDWIAKDRAFDAHVPGGSDDHWNVDSYVIQHSAGFDSDELVITNLEVPYTGFSCFDQCDGDLTHTAGESGHLTGISNAKQGVTLSWHDGYQGIQEHNCGCQGNTLSEGFKTLVPGTYALKYSCEDEAGHVTTKCRTILNEDHTKPIITVLEADQQTYEATRSDNYVDAGATCSDEVDGNISQDVEVSGDVVNLARVGVYTIKYNCQDSAANTADEATRTVVVQDTSCPSCVLSADTTSAAVGATVSIEASFPYNDAGAVATDSLQGSFGICSVWSNGEMMISYKSIVNVERTGVYEITYRVKDSNGNWNDGTSCSGGQTGSENVRTVTIVDTLRPVIELKYNSQVIHQSAKEFSLPAENSKTHLAKVGLTHSHTGAIHDGTGNPAGSFMAEEASTSSVNGWVVGAVASAVSGLALLGYSLRKSAPVATSVPV